jgi:UDP-MurNAc hydroxylase
MQLEWVNHAGFIIHAGSLHLMTDPWIEGPAFNNGWKLLSLTQFRYADFERITHVWVSHEHPDHFSPPNLKRIPEQFRARIQFLFHHTKDKRVVNLSKAMGFPVQELPPGEWVDLGGRVSIICGTQGLIDSWMAVKAGNTLLLNLNDCVFARESSLNQIKYLLQPAGPIDVLLTQFSYANWVGNPGDHASQRFHAAKKRAEMSRQLKLFRPKAFIPFASFVVFSHAENAWMNEGINRIGYVYQFSVNDLGVSTQVLYPGDIWTAGEPRSSIEAISNYERDLEEALASKPEQGPPIPFERLREIATRFVVEAKAKNNRMLLWAIPPATIRLSDLAVTVELSYRKGLLLSDGNPDIITSSDSLAYCMMYEWGGDTLAINGRYQVPAQGNVDRFFRIFRVPAHNSAGNSVNLGFLSRQLAKRINLGT